MMKQQAFLDATKKVKIQTVIEKMKKDATFRDGHWSSSEYFERDLKQKGIIPPIEIHHQYKFPKGFSEKTFEDHVMWLEDLKWFEPEKILDTNNYVDRLTAGSSMSKEEIQDLKKQLSEPLKGLNDNEKQEVIDILSKQQLSANEELKKQINAVQKLNPELQDIKIPAGKEVDFLIGVTSGFHYVKIILTVALVTTQ